MSTRLAAIFADIGTLSATSYGGRVAQLIASASQLGCLFAWLAEQTRFAADLLGGEKIRSDESRSHSTRERLEVAGVQSLRLMPDSDVGILCYEAVRDSGAKLRVMTSGAAKPKELRVDMRFAENMVSLLTGRRDGRPAAVLARFLTAATRIAAMDSDLAEEASGLRLSARSRLLRSPRSLISADGVMVEAAIAGTPVQELTGSRKEAVYCAAVKDWVQTILLDALLIVSIRRDRLWVDGRRLVLSRWAGAGHPGQAAVDLVLALIAAKTSDTGADRDQAQERIAAIVAGILGLAGSREAISDPILALVEDSQYVISRHRLTSQIVILPGVEYHLKDSIELFLLLRQLIWLRDLGIACGVRDLSRPWQELAGISNVGPSPLGTAAQAITADVTNVCS